MAHDYGLIPPDCIEEATNEYREEEDTIGRFVAEKLEQYAGSETRAGEIYEAYRGWCEAEGQKPKHNSIFGREMRNHAEAIKKGNLTYYVNIRIRT